MASRSLTSKTEKQRLSGRVDEYKPDAPFRMIDYAWFRITGQIPSLPSPYYLGRGVAFNADYRSEKHTPMPGHGVLKISLTRGGIFRCQNEPPLQLKAGQATLRIVGETEANDGYDPDYHGEWGFIGIIFRGDAAMSILRGLVARHGWVYDLPLDSSLVKHLRAMANQQTHSVEMTASEGMALVQSVLAAVARSAERDTITVGRLKVAQAVERTIVDNLSENYSVDELARIHEISREHLTRIFTQEYGMPPHQYAVEMKVREAGRLLRHTNVPIKSIMGDLGFTPRTFYRVFKNTTGLTPTGYRQSDTEF